MLFCGLANLGAADFTGKTIRDVEGAPAVPALETRPGGLFDAIKLQHDVHSLWQSGRWSDVQVEALPDGDAVRLVFHLRARQILRVRKVHVDPATPGIRVEVEPGAEIDPPGAQRIAAQVRRQLVSSGYLEAKAQARLVLVSPGTADLEIHIDRRRAIDVGSVTFSGDLGMKAVELRHALHATRSKTMFPGLPGIWKGWHVRPPYNPETLEADLANLRSLYYHHGYFDAGVRLDSAETAGGQARLAIALEAGKPYQVGRLNELPTALPPDKAMDSVCRELFDERRDAERRGVLDFSARLEIQGEGPSVDIATRSSTGPAYRVSRIEFRGNHRFSDESLRRTLLLDEGAPLDQGLLRRSLARLNRNGWFEPLTESSVVVNTPPGSDRAGVIIGLKERQARNWYFSGPVGPMSVGGPLRLAIGSRLPAWGQGALELSTYTLSLNLMLFAKPIGALIPFLPNRRFIQLLTIERPLLPGQRLLSGFAIAPQLGWQGMLAGYGVSQTRNFLQGFLQTDRGLTPDLLVTVSHGGREGILRCEPPKARFNRVRQTAGAAVNVLFSFSPL